MEKSAATARCALITGSARRIGAAIATSLHQAGMNIVIHYNTSQEAALALCQELNKQRKDSAIVVQADLNVAGREKFLIKEAHSKWQRLDVLVNNASRFYPTPMGAISEFDWEDLFASNLKTPFFLSQAAAPMLAQHQGVIINITDVNSYRPLANYSVYSIAKAGLAYMTKVLALELGPKIRVNAVAPGYIIWPEGENSLSDAEKQMIIQRTPLQRVGCEQDIAKAVLFLVQDAPFVTGQMLSVDGGRAL